MDKGHIIHQPKQQRSLARYHHILDTAAALFVGQGHETLNTNQIAHEAGVSVGSFYRFFSSKEALITALVERYLAGLAAVLPPIPSPPEHMDAVVRLMLEHVLAFDEQYASVAQLFMNAPMGPFAQARLDLHHLLKGWVEKLLAAYHPQLTDEQRHLCAASGMGIVKGMLTMTQPPDLIPLEQVLTETVCTLMAYVEGFVKRA